MYYNSAHVQADLQYQTWIYNIPHTDYLHVVPRDRFTSRIHPTMQSTGKLQLSAEEIHDFTADDLQDYGEIGRGAFGAVNKMVHKKWVIGLRLCFDYFHTMVHGLVIMTNKST